MKKTTVLVVGGFDPLHIGHIDHFKEAKRLGDKLIVLVQGDDWLIRKKRRYFMKMSDRMSIIRTIKYVDYVIGWENGKDDVANALELLKPDIFAKGGDRKSIEYIPKEEVDICKKLKIKIVFGVDGRIRSSSKMLKEWKIESYNQNC